MRHCVPYTECVDVHHILVSNVISKLNLRSDLCTDIRRSLWRRLIYWSLDTPCPHRIKIQDYKRITRARHCNQCVGAAAIFIQARLDRDQWVGKESRGTITIIVLLFFCRRAALVVSLSPGTSLWVPKGKGVYSSSGIRQNIVRTPTSKEAECRVDMGRRHARLFSLSTSMRVMMNLWSSKVRPSVVLFVGRGGTQELSI